ncbi:methionyl-tRNA formyltransferase [Azospirillum humicireducens]|nr:formyltransferase family protein [Azospirillum humicireducens]
MIRPLRFAVLGRGKPLLTAAQRLQAAGHRLGFVATTRPAGYEGAAIGDFAMLAATAEARFAEGPSWIRDADILDWIAGNGFDLAISMNWLTVLPAQVRALFGAGVFNAHPGDLPRYRGNACPTWAILADESHVGLCIHLMSDDLDAGPVAFRERFPMAGHDFFDVWRWVEDRVPALFHNLASAVEAGTLALQQQPDNAELSLRCFPRKAEDARIDWAAPAEDILRLIRSSTRPLEGAFSYLEDGVTRVTIWRAEVCSLPFPYLAIPGQVLGTDGGLPLIACKPGALRLLDLEISGHSVPDSMSRLLLSLRNRLI